MDMMGCMADSTVKAIYESEGYTPGDMCYPEDGEPHPFTPELADACRRIASHAITVLNATALIIRDCLYGRDLPDDRPPPGAHRHTFHPLHNRPPAPFGPGSFSHDHSMLRTQRHGVRPGHLPRTVHPQAGPHADRSITRSSGSLPTLREEDLGPLPDLSFSA